MSTGISRAIGVGLWPARGCAFGYSTGLSRGRCANRRAGRELAEDRPDEGRNLYSPGYRPGLSLGRATGQPAGRYPQVGGCCPSGAVHFRYQVLSSLGKGLDRRHFGVGREVIVNHRQADRNRGSRSGFARDVKCSAMQFDDRLGKGQTQPSALVIAVQRRADAVKRLHHERDILGVHPDAGVGDANFQLTSAHRARYRDSPLCRRELDGVADQVDENLSELDGIEIDYRPDRWIALDDDFDIGRRRGLTKHH